MQDLFLEGGSTLQLSLLYCSDGADRLQTANQIAAQLAEVESEVTLEAKKSGGIFFDAQFRFL